MRLIQLMPAIVFGMALTAGCNKSEPPVEAPPAAPGPAVPGMAGGPPGPPMPGGPPAASISTAKSGPAAGKIVFAANCARCHGAAGQGKLPGTPKFNSAAWQKAQKDADLLQTIHNGKGRMPRFAGRLSEKEITDALAYVRTLAKTGKK